MSKIPKLRFKEFSGEWEEKKLGELLDYEQPTKYIVKSTKYDNNYIIPVLTAGKSFILGYTNETNGIFTNKPVIIFDDFTTANHYVDFNFKVKSSAMKLLKIKDKANNLKFIHEYMQRLYFPIGEHKRYWLSEYSHLKLKLPCIKEQEKIANFLSLIDMKIEQLTKKESLLKDYKKGIMQKLFNQEIRFKDGDKNEFPKWEEKKLGELLDYEQPTKYIVKSTKYDNNYIIPVLTAGKSFILGYTNETNGIFTNKPVIIFDDFTTANHYVDFNFKVKSSAMKLLKIKDKANNLKFIHEYMQRLYFPIGEHKRYWLSEYSHLKLKLPCIEEQEKIASFLSSIDMKIELLQKQLLQTKKYKKALLEQMFV